MTTSLLTPMGVRSLCGDVLAVQPRRGVRRPFSPFGPPLHPQTERVRALTEVLGGVYKGRVRSMLRDIPRAGIGGRASVCRLDFGGPICCRRRPADGVGDLRAGRLRLLRDGDDRPGKHDRRLVTKYRGKYVTAPIKRSDVPRHSCRGFRATRPEAGL